MLKEEYRISLLLWFKGIVLCNWTFKIQLFIKHDFWMVKLVWTDKNLINYIYQRTSETLLRYTAINKNILDNVPVNYSRTVKNI